MNGIYALEDGTVFRGAGFGARATMCGEAVFNTSMTGYQEILTDPSYKGQIVAMTYPQIGNYGINPADVESWRPHVTGFVVRELSTAPSNWRSEITLPEYLNKNGIPAIQGVDTRALTKILRVKGAMKSCLSTEDLSDKEAVQRARDWKGIVGVDYVKEVTHREAFAWDPDDQQSGNWKIARDAAGEMQYRDELPPADIPIVAFDFGMKYNILRRLRQHGFRVQVVPATATANDVMKYKPRGVFLSNGPGDPEALDYAHKSVRELIGHVPMFGICLGNQILGFAYGGKTFKLMFGHRGANQPVKDICTGKVVITSQNHGFAVEPKTLNNSEVEVSQINLNDQTVEGMRHKKHPIFSVQYHPEASPGPHDAGYLFNDFRQLILKHEGRN
ncbi:MAG: Carbamoyl-phosphate synthase small chain [Verrucomicrobiae bacterium]|nr:Carbamoyl-phosphate synthase small chain [Verrucomicrobiae bacterium]